MAKKYAIKYVPMEVESEDDSFDLRKLSLAVRDLLEGKLWEEFWRDQDC